MLNSKQKLGAVNLVIILLVISFTLYKCLSSKSEERGKSEYTYILDCKKLAEHQARHPSTVKHKMSEDSFYQAKNGNIAVTIGFSAKNSFGAEIDHTARCIFPVTGNPEIVIR